MLKAGTEVSYLLTRALMRIHQGEVLALLEELELINRRRYVDGVEVEGFIKHQKALYLNFFRKRGRF